MACGALTGFITIPFLVHRLGATTYGLWILIASLTSYFNLADLGLRASITRHVAFFRAKGDQESVNAILSTAQMILAGAAAVTVVLTLGLVALFPRLGNVPADQLRDVRMAILIAGFTIAATLAMSIFDAALWAYERLDLLNSIDIFYDLAETACLFYFLWHGGPLITIAWIALVKAVCAEGSKCVACLRMDRSLRIAPSHIRRWAARYLFGFGIWKFLWSVGTRATSQGGPLIIWARLSAAMATPYSVVSRLVGTAKGFATVGMGVVTPTATTLYAREQHAHQCTLFVEGGSYCLAFSLFFVAGIALLGKCFITLWIGPSLAVYAGAATILALGEALPMSQWVSSGILLGRERHRVLACGSFVETFLVIGLGLALTRTMGFTGLCLAIAVPSTLCRGVLPLVYGSLVLGISLWRYIRRALVPPVIAVAIPAAAMAVLIRRRPPLGWFDLILYALVFSLACAIACGVIVVGSEQRKNLLLRLRGQPAPGVGGGESHAFG
jgi:O-antigen/teichoic acid export membrane protein